MMITLKVGTHVARNSVDGFAIYNEKPIPDQAGTWWIPTNGIGIALLRETFNLPEIDPTDNRLYLWRVTATGLEQIEPPVSAPQPEPPAPPTPVAPTEPGLYPLADGSTVWLAGPDYAGDWIGIHGKYVRCWRYDGSGRGVPAVIGPRIPKPIDDDAAIDRVRDLIAAGEVEYGKDDDDQWYLEYTDIRHRMKPTTITPPPADWPQEMREAVEKLAAEQGRTFA